jgi:adenylate cyclase
MSRDVEVAILFADVVGSTQLYEKLGDDKAREMVARCLEIMREATEDQSGRVIKTMGDEVMSTFPSADEAMTAAKQMQETISSDEELDHEDGHVAIRIGCHFGPVVQENRDIFGSAVHTANRMTSQAKAHQIITTAATVELLSDGWETMVRQIDVATVRGQSDEVVLFEVLWQPDDATSMLPTVGLGQKRNRSRRVRLSFKGQEVTVDETARAVWVPSFDDTE